MLQPTERRLHYEKSYLSQDVLAGCIVAMLLIPQSMAYAMLAGAPPVIGLYAAGIPMLAYLLFSSSRHLSVGPVSIVALLAYTGVSRLAELSGRPYLEIISTLSLLVGLLLAVLGLLRVGRLLDKIDHAVITGFTSAAAIIICLQQVGPIAGIHLPREDQVLPLLYALAGSLIQFHLVTLLIGAISLAALYALHRLLPIAIGPLVILMLSAVVVKRFELAHQGVSIVGPIPTGLPEPSWAWPSLELALQLLPTALAIVLITFFESYAIASSVASKSGYKIRADRELLGLGAANVTSSLVGAMPVAGAISRTAVNYGSGARTKVASLITVLLLLVTVSYFTQGLYYMPKAALAAIIVFSVMRLIDVKGILSHTDKATDPTSYWIQLITFLTALLIGIVQGLLIGIVLCIVLQTLRRRQNPAS